jgi:hypothetical protein
MLDYAYSLDGSVQYHGITFDHPEAALRGVRWLGEGPHRVWKKPPAGTWLGVHEVMQFDQQLPSTGEKFTPTEALGPSAAWTTAARQAQPADRSARHSDNDRSGRRQPP